MLIVDVSTMNVPIDMPIVDMSIVDMPMVDTSVVLLSTHYCTTHRLVTLIPVTVPDAVRAPQAWGEASHITHQLCCALWRGTGKSTKGHHVYERKQQKKVLYFKDHRGPPRNCPETYCSSPPLVKFPTLKMKIKSK